MRLWSLLESIALLARSLGRHFKAFFCVSSLWTGNTGPKCSFPEAWMWLAPCSIHMITINRLPDVLLLSRSMAKHHLRNWIKCSMWSCYIMFYSYCCFFQMKKKDEERQRRWEGEINCKRMEERRREKLCSIWNWFLRERPREAGNCCYSPSSLFWHTHTHTCENTPAHTLLILRITPTHIPMHTHTCTQKHTSASSTRSF